MKNFDHSETVFNDTPKQKNLFDKEDEFDVKFENDKYGVILNNIDKLKEGKWYRVQNNEKRETIKEMMRAGFLPDVSFNDDFSMIKRENTELHLIIRK